MMDTLLASGELAGVSFGAVLIMIAVLSSAACVFIAVIIASNWRRMRIAGLETRLKEQMLEWGMSADEIERVIRARIAGNEEEG